MSKTIDFDAYRAERAKDNIILKAFGEEIELPPSPPLSNMLDIIDMNERLGGSADVPAEEARKMLELTLGKDQFKMLVKNGITLEESYWLIQKMWEIYGPQGNEDEQDDTKNNQPSPSQKNGDS